VLLIMLPVVPARVIVPVPLNVPLRTIAPDTFELFPRGRLQLLLIVFRVFAV
jgi:hypothetical protein